MLTYSSYFSILPIIIIAVILACFSPIVNAQINPEQNFDDAQVYWPSAFKRSLDSDVYAFPGLRGLRGKRDPLYNKRVPMMSLKGLRGKRAHFSEE